MTPRDVLLVPAPEHRAALLAEGPCGASAPRVELCSCGEWYPPSGFVARRRHEAHRVEGEDREALALVWDSRVIAEGVDRLRRFVRLNPHRDYSPEEALGLARSCPSVGTVITLGVDS